MCTAVFKRPCDYATQRHKTRQVAGTLLLLLLLWLDSRLLEFLLSCGAAELLLRLGSWWMDILLQLQLVMCGAGETLLLLLLL